jgi:hypothetical protein
MLSLDVPSGKCLSLDVTLLLDLWIQLRRRRLILDNLFLCAYRHYARRVRRISLMYSAGVATNNALDLSRTINPKRHEKPTNLPFENYPA